MYSVYRAVELSLPVKDAQWRFPVEVSGARQVDDGIRFDRFIA